MYVGELFQNTVNGEELRNFGDGRCLFASFGRYSPPPFTSTPPFRYLVGTHEHWSKLHKGIIVYSMRNKVTSYFQKAENHSSKFLCHLKPKPQECAILFPIRTSGVYSQRDSWHDFSLLSSFNNSENVFHLLLLSTSAVHLNWSDHLQSLLDHLRADRITVLKKVIMLSIKPMHTICIATAQLSINITFSTRLRLVHIHWPFIDHRYFVVLASCPFNFCTILL